MSANSGRALKSAFKKGGGGAYDSPVPSGDIEAQPIAHGHDEPNPFESGAGSVPPAVWAQPPPGEGRATNGLSAEELAMREANLKAREERLRQKENQLDERARNIGATLYPNNWPCKCWGVAYHDIANDIPDEKQKYVRRFYYALLLTYFVLLFNALTVIITAFSCSSSGSVSAFLWAAIYCVCGFPLAWLFWYKPIYQMNKKNSGGLRWIVFFFVFGIHWIFLVLLIIGYNSGGGAGIFAIIDDLSNSCQASALFAIADTVFAGILFLWSSYLMQAAWREWRKGGGSVKGMKGDMTKAAVSTAAEHAMQSDV